MEGRRPSKAGLDSALVFISKRLREEAKNVSDEALPERWVELILHLEEKERRAAEASKDDGRSGGASA
jgi:hypothetical protein